MQLIVKRPFDQLIKELHGAFMDQPDVKIKIDNRREERRKDSQPIALDERRQQDRRKKKETLLDIIIDV